MSMSIQLQILDVDYTLTNSKPHVRIFGKTPDGKSITVFASNLLPYFYILPKDGKKQELITTIKEKFNGIVIGIDEVDKFLPIGYQKEPTKMIKIILNNPAMVPTVRDGLIRHNSVEDIFEADILFKYRFMIDHNLFGMRWYEVDGDGIGTTTVKTDKKIEALSIKELNKDENVSLKYLSIDIEALSSEGGLPDPNKDQIIMLSLAFYPTYNGKSSLVLISKRVKNNKETLGFATEKEMLEEFLKIIDDFDPDILLGYNSSNFDFPYIDARLSKNNLPRTLGRCAQKQMRIDKFGNQEKITIPGRVVVDVYNLIREAVVKFGLYRGLKRYGLGNVSQLILGESKVDILHTEIDSYWRDNGLRFQKLIDYSRRDAELPLRILFDRNMIDKFIEISKVSGLVLQDVLDGGEATRIDNLLLREFNRRNYVIPNKPTAEALSRINEERSKHGLKGGFVLNPTVGFHDKCVVYLDFKSMYPTIMMAFNICPTTLIRDDENVEFIKTSYGTRFVSPKVSKGIVPQILEYLISTRDKLKKEMKSAKTEEKKRILFAKQYAFKTVANAFYGYSGYTRARIYVLDIANTITHIGRESISRTKDIVETKTDYKVVYSDTDSVMVKLNTLDVGEAFKIGDSLVETINKGLDDLLKIKTENVFRSLLILSKKRYAGWSFEPTDDGWEETIVTKGIETVRRDWCNLVSETLQEVLNTILKGQDTAKALKIVKDRIEDIKNGRMDIDKLVITKSISKSLKSYKGVQPHVELVRKMRKRDPASLTGVGDRIGYVIVQGLGMLSKRAEDPEYVKKHKLKVDAKYYIESQLLPPLERVFESLKINRSDLMNVGKQMGLFDVMKIQREENGFVEYVTDIEGFICISCNNVFRRIPLIGRCDHCNGEVVFYQGEHRSKVLNPVAVPLSR